QEKWRVPQVHFGPRFDGKARHELGVYRRCKRCNARRNCFAVLVELVLPQQTRKDRAAQALLVGKRCEGGRSLVCPIDRPVGFTLVDAHLPPTLSLSLSLSLARWHAGHSPGKR